MERTDYKQIVILSGTALAVYVSFRYLLPLIVPFLFSCLLAVWLYPAAAYLKKRWNISNTLSGAVLIFLFALILGAVVFGLLKALIAQAGNVISNLPVYERLVLEEAKTICGSCDRLLGIEAGGTFRLVRQNLDEGLLSIKSYAAPLLSIEAIFSEEMLGGIRKMFGVFWILFVIIIGAFFIIKDMEDLKIIFEESSFYGIFKRLFGNMSAVGIAYLKAQLFIVICCAFLCSMGLTLVRVSNSLLWGIGISVFDALPVLGSGLILIPWAIYILLKGNWYYAAVLFTTYVLCQLIREVVENKILGDKIGIKPVFTLLAMYVGTQLFGIAGFILGPIGFLILKNAVDF